jgi:signal transduction histidine kinase
MKIFGEELGATGRWYIALPPLLLIGFLLGLFFLAVASQSSLNDENQRVHDALLREQVLGEFMGYMTDAESAQRAYLLTGSAEYLQSYRNAAAKIGPSLDEVHRQYGAGDDQAFQALRVLTGQRLGEMETGIALYPNRGGVKVGTAAGKQTMDDISSLAATMRSAEATRLANDTRQWQHDFDLSRLIMGAGAVLSLALVLLAARLVYADMRRRARQTTGLRDQKVELERLVDERTRDLATLSTHLQGISEKEKSALSRELHDELGGLLVAARMDVSWLQQRMKSDDPAVEQRFKRIHDSLSAGVDLKRRVVEELRPTLLDNMGLIAALRWQFRETCRVGGLKGEESLPDTEPKFDPDAAIGVFRVAQESLTNIVKHAGARSVAIEVRLEPEWFVMRIRDDGKGLPDAPATDGGPPSHGLAAMRHRITALGGRCEWRRGDAGGTVVSATVPLGRVLA